MKKLLFSHFSPSYSLTYSPTIPQPTSHQLVTSSTSPPTNITNLRSLSAAAAVAQVMHYLVSHGVDVTGELGDVVLETAAPWMRTGAVERVMMLSGGE